MAIGRIISWNCIASIVCYSFAILTLVKAKQTSSNKTFIHFNDKWSHRNSSLILPISNNEAERNSSLETDFSNLATRDENYTKSRPSLRNQKKTKKYESSSRNRQNNTISTQKITQSKITSTNTASSQYKHLDLLEFMRPDKSEKYRRIPKKKPDKVILKNNSNSQKFDTISITGEKQREISKDTTLSQFFDKEMSDDDNEYITELQSEEQSAEVLINNPILSSLITGQQIEGLNNDDLLSTDHQSMQIKQKVLQEVPTKRTMSKIGYDVGVEKNESRIPSSLSQNARSDLEDPEEYTSDKHNYKISGVTQTLQKKQVYDKKHANQNNNIEDILSAYFHLHNHTLNATKDDLQVPKTLFEEKKAIKFVQVSPSDSRCMDGSSPGYYIRRGFKNGARKWIVHLHGGAWCYDLRSCSKRRNSMLGSTRHLYDDDISGFFHGILSDDPKINPHFYNWNVAVLSYCDGGLFSGNRQNRLTGNKRNFYFQGRKVLQSQLKSLQANSLLNGEEVILSGTSAGGLALVLQGNFMKRFLPEKAKVRALIDAGLFLDQDSVWNTSISSLQFKALYSLHRPTLNRKCLEDQPTGKKYKCLFPEYALKYLKIPLFIVNSLYDHWQLSYLEGVYCVYDDQKCNRQAHDRILHFRNKIYTAISEIMKQKQGTGVFANSCFAHGQVILDFTWSRVKIDNKSISDSFYDWYKDNDLNQSKQHYHVDCKYPCNGSCPRSLASRCVNNFIKASEHRRKRDAELC